jgi:central glycolytic genes regulator
MPMRKLVELERQLVPDVIEILKKRYTILRHVIASRQVGRRTLAATLGMTERVLRAEADDLKALGLIEMDPGGMRISDSGRKLLEELEPFVSDLFGLSDMEERLKEAFALKMVVVVPGDSDVSPLAKKELGREGASALRKLANNGEVIAVNGGSTMAEVAEHLTVAANFKGSCFVPARGGLGESVELQANTIASTMAKRTGSQYRLLHVPDHLSEDAYQSLIQEPNIKEILQVIGQTRIVVHGIGDAIVMAKRRQMGEAAIAGLMADGALAEAFGYYFDRNGQVVSKMATVGLGLEQLEHMDTVIAVAGGKSKGEAIAAVLRFGHEDVLVTDEAAAHEIVKLL